MTSSWTRCCSSANRRHLFVWKQQDEISHDNSITAAYRHLNTIKSSGLSGNEFRPAVPIHLLYPMPSLPPSLPPTHSSFGSVVTVLRHLMDEICNRFRPASASPSANPLHLFGSIARVYWRCLRLMHRLSSPSDASYLNVARRYHLIKIRELSLPLTVTIDY